MQSDTRTLTQDKAKAAADIGDEQNILSKQLPGLLWAAISSRHAIMNKNDYDS